MIKLHTHRIFLSRKSSHYQSINEAYTTMVNLNKKQPSADLAVLSSNKKLNFIQKTAKFIKAIFNANKAVL